MTGSATFTTVPSRNAMLEPRTAVASAQRGSLAGGGQGLRADCGTADSNTKSTYPIGRPVPGCIVRCEAPPNVRHRARLQSRFIGNRRAHARACGVFEQVLRSR